MLYQCVVVAVFFPFGRRHKQGCARVNLFSLWDGEPMPDWTKCFKLIRYCPPVYPKWNGACRGAEGVAERSETDRRAPPGPPSTQRSPFFTPKVFFLLPEGLLSLTRHTHTLAQSATFSFFLFLPSLDGDASHFFKRFFLYLPSLVGTEGPSHTLSQVYFDTFPP